MHGKTNKKYLQWNGRSWLLGQNARRSNYFVRNRGIRLVRGMAFGIRLGWAVELAADGAACGATEGDCRTPPITPLLRFNGVLKSVVWSSERRFRVMILFLMISWTVACLVRCRAASVACGCFGIFVCGILKRLEGGVDRDESELPERMVLTRFNCTSG